MDPIAFLNEGLDGKSEYRFYVDRGVLAIWFYVGADRKRKTTSIALPQAIDAKFRAEARRCAAELTQLARVGRVLEATSSEIVRVASTLDELLEAWLKEQANQYPDSIKTRRIQAANFLEYFKTSDAEGTPLQRLVAPKGPQKFVNARMRERSKETVKKEVTVMMQFLNWMAEDERGYIAAAPPRPTYRPKDVGRRMGPQRDEPVHLDEDVALQIINLLPEYAARGGRKGGRLPQRAFVLRDRMRFAYELGLRPSTIARIKTPTHWSPGLDFLRVTPDTDKGRNQGQKRKVRVVPLTKVARAILEKYAPERGIIFGRHDIRVQWKRAACAVLGEDEGMRCAPYDLRHGAAYRMKNLDGSTMGTMQMLGHSKATTTDEYLRPNEKAAREVTGKLDARNAKLSGELSG